MTDIFREVEEEVRRERFEKLWKQYGTYVVAIAVVVAAAIGGFQLWKSYEQGEREKNAAAYMAAIRLAESGKPLDAATQLDELGKNGTAGYKLLAQLARADALMAANKPQDALSGYKQVAEAAGSSELGDVARIRAAWIMVESAPKSEVQSVLGSLTDGANVWRFMAREILAYADYVAGRTETARQAYDKIASDTGAPAGVRNRARIMSQFLTSGGDADYGIVPPPPKPATQATPAGAAPAQNGTP